MNVIVHRTWIAISEGLEQLKIAIIVVFVGKNAFTKHYILGKKIKLYGVNRNIGKEK